MDQSGLLLLTALGTIFVLGGLALQPIWRRMRRERRKRSGGMTLSIGRARERLLWVNAFGSIAIGGVMLGIVQIELPIYQREIAVKKELERFKVTCSHKQISVHNQGDQLRHVRLSNAEVFLSHGYLGEEPDHWRISFSGEQMLVSGEVGHFELPEIEECKARLIQFTFEPPLYCDLRFRFESELADTRQSCRLQ